MGILQFNIFLKEIEPKIWRRFLVKDNISFQGLHDTIQIVMGWQNYHLFEFRIGNETIAPDENGFNLAEGTLGKLSKSKEFLKMLEQASCKKGTTTLDLAKVNKILGVAEKNKPKNKSCIDRKIGELIKNEGKKFTYTYDLGDNWEHSLMLEKSLEEKDVKACPVCLAGERSCPPEDCGSVSGYYELMEIKKNKNHPEYEERIVEWLGEDFDFEKFDIEKTNKELKKAAREIK